MVKIKDNLTEYVYYSNNIAFFSFHSFFIEYIPTLLYPFPFIIQFEGQGECGHYAINIIR